MAGRWQSARGSAGRLLRNEALVRIAANSSWLLGDRLIRAALGFVVGAWVARYLGPDRFGHYAYVLTFIAFFQAVANLGADSIVVRDIARDPASAPDTLGSILRLRVIAGMTCWALAVALTAVIDPTAHDTILMTAIVGGVMVFQAADTVDLWFQSQIQSRRTVVAKLPAYLLASGVKVVLIMMKAPLIAFAAAFLLDFAAAAIALGLAYRAFPAPNRWRLDVGIARELLARSWPFLASGLSIIIYMRIDQILIKALQGDREVGFYAAALPLSQIWQMIPLTLAVSVAPYVAQRKMVGESEYYAALAIIFRLFLIISIMAASITAIAAPFLLPAIYGPEFRDSVTIVQIHVFTNVFIALGVAQGIWVANENRGRMLLSQTLAGAAVAIVGNWYAIQYWGARGAAVVAVASFATSAFLSNIFLAPKIFLMQMGIRVRP